MGPHWLIYPILSYPMNVHSSSHFLVFILRSSSGARMRIAKFEIKQIKGVFGYTVCWAEAMPGTGITDKMIRKMNALSKRRQ